MLNLVLILIVIFVYTFYYLRKMRDKKKFLRPKETKFPQAGDVTVRTKWGETVSVSSKDFKRIKDFYKTESIIGETTSLSGRLRVLSKDLNKELIISPASFNDKKFELIEIIDNKTTPSEGDVKLYNSRIKEYAIMDFDDWLEVEDNWELVGLNGIETFEEEDTVGGEYVILGNGHTLIIKASDYSKVSNHWEHVDDIVAETRLVVYYDIQDISSPTTIFTNYDNSVKSIEIDGNETISEFAQGNVAYQFSAVGEHIIKYEFNNPTTVGSNVPVLYNVATAKHIIIPNTFTSIGSQVFISNANLTSVTIGISVTSIGDSAFGGCSGLTSVNIPNSVTSIGSGAFSGCYGLTSVHISDLAAWCNISFLIKYDSNPLYHAHHLYLNGTEVTDLIIPDGVTSIGSSAFYNCSGLTSVTIPNSVTSIGSSAFGGCNSLATIIVESDNTVYDSRNDCNAIIESSTNELIFGCKNTTIPNSVTSIREMAFFDCIGLTSLTIPNNVTSIGFQAFSDCRSLMSVTIPNSVTTIGYSAFENCTSLISVTIEATTPPTLGSQAFAYNASGRKIYVPADSVAAYKAAAGWSTYASDIVAIEEVAEDPL